MSNKKPTNKQNKNNNNKKAIDNYFWGFPPPFVKQTTITAHAKIHFTKKLMPKEQMLPLFLVDTSEK